MGSVIAAEVRQAILQDTGLTCCAGIAHNKLLAKLVGGWRKPNMQTTLLPEDAESLLSGLQARDIPGITNGKVNTVVIIVKCQFPPQVVLKVNIVTCTLVSRAQ